MKPSEALVLWMQIGLKMQEEDPARFTKAVEEMAEKADLQTEDASPPDERASRYVRLTVLDGGAA